MPLSRIVDIDRRFARSARIDADLKGTPPLVGYVLQASTAKALTAMAQAQAEIGQGAFTWTGPYGGGKSSAALLVGNLVAGDDKARKLARGLVGRELSALFDKAFPISGGRWRVAPVTGSRISMRTAIAAAGEAALGWSPATVSDAEKSDAALIAALLASGGQGGGVLLILDELGKLLEHAASERNDIHLLQDLAEHASRSGGKLVVIGILHQAFEQYAARVSREAREEWAKVQGRYLDLSFLAGADETVALLARAIRVKERPDSAEEAARAVAEAVAKRRPTDIDSLAAGLASAWPLNPVTTLLLGPVSRQRFAQNERSVFGFLSSAEPHGFQAHLAACPAEAPATYGPDQLWDYLAANFGMALASGGDGARFSLAFEAIERAAAKGSALHVRLTKAAAVVEFFRNGSGVALALDFLTAAVPDVPARKVEAAVRQLLEWAILIEQPRLGGFALFSGSDFDLEDALQKVVDAEGLDAERVARLPERVGLGFAAAKRHYFRTGALRTFEVVLQLVGEADTAAKLVENLAARQRANGALVLLLSDGALELTKVRNLAKVVANGLGDAGVIAAVGAAPNSYALRPLAAELFAVERVMREHPRLEGDRIARREVGARHSQCIDGVHRELELALDSTQWRLAPKPDEAFAGSLAVVASALADVAFHQAPILRSELLQRDRPSSNAMAAVRELCHAMVHNGAEKDLGFNAFPAGMGLYLTVLQPFGLHRKLSDGRYGFSGPDKSEAGRSLSTVWSAAEARADVPLSEIYSHWARSPIGLKAGVMPVLALANILARRERLAVYVDGVFQTALDDVFVDKLLQSPETIRLRRIDRTNRDTALLEGLGAAFGLPPKPEALPVAQALFRRFEGLPAYAQRTERLTEVTRKVRDVVLKSSDPENLLFDALPTALGKDYAVKTIRAAIEEAEAFFPQVLDDLTTALAAALGVGPDFVGMAVRAESIKGLTNDWAFDAFAMRAGAFEAGEGDIEGLAGLLLHKSPRQWSDRDADQALIEIARLGQRFRELETLAAVRNRHSSAEAVALMVGVDPKTVPFLESFQLSDAERRLASGLSEQVVAILREQPVESRVRLAALARAILQVSEQKAVA